MLLKNIYKGEHFVTDGKVLYRKIEDGFMAIAGIPEEPITLDPDTKVKIVNPWNWFAKREKDD